MTIWIRRDSRNQLWLYTKEPIFDKNLNTYFPEMSSNMSRLNSHLFPDIQKNSKPVAFSVEQIEEGKQKQVNTTVERFS